MTYVSVWWGQYLIEPLIPYNLSGISPSMEVVQQSMVHTTILYWQRGRSVRQVWITDWAEAPEFVVSIHNLSLWWVYYIKYKIKRCDFICIYIPYISVECAPGTFLNTSTSSCDICPIGSYSGVQGMSMCTRCGPGTSTYSAGSTNIRDCKGELQHN